MRRPDGTMIRWTALAAGLLLATGCIADGADDDRDAGDTFSGDASQNSDTAPGGRACGSDLTCGEGTVCVVDETSADCTADTGDARHPCPAGTLPSQCGGAGVPCCCGPKPPNVYRCVEAPDCGDTPACDCVESVCPEDRVCQPWATPDGQEIFCGLPEVP